MWGYGMTGPNLESVILELIFILLLDCIFGNTILTIWRMDTGDCIWNATTGDLQI